MKFNAVTITILLAAAGLGYYFWTKRKKAAASLGAAAGTAAANAAINTAAGAAGQIINQGGAGLGTPGAPAPTSGSTSGGKYTFSDAELNSLLNVGKSGITVKALQIYLNKTGANLAIDGIFGPITEQWLFKWDDVKQTTLKTLDITAVDLGQNKVFGRQSGWGPEGTWSGSTFI